MTEEEEAEAVKVKNEQIMRAYSVAFNSPAGQIVLTDLAPFCRAVDSVAIVADDGAIDVHRTFAAIGRNEVWKRIQRFARLNEDDILRLQLGRISVKPMEDSE